MAYSHPSKVFDAASTATAGTQYSKPVECQGRYNVRWQVQGTETSTPVGAFKVLASDDAAAVRADREKGIYGPSTGATAKWFQVTLPAGSVHIDPASTSVTVTLPDDEIAWDGTNAAKFGINLDSPFAFMCLAYTRSSGGAASTLTAWGAARE